VFVGREHEMRATVKGQPVEPASVRCYLSQKFDHELADVQAAREALAKAYPSDQLASRAYSLYEQFRPDVPERKTGWGTAGPLDLDAIRSLAESHR
jgi:hypothetical protein